MAGLTVEELLPAARSFVRTAFDSLREDHVVPTPRAHRFIAVGRDYFGDDVRGEELHVFEKLLEEGFPERFAARANILQREFPSGYSFSFLQAVSSLAVASATPSPSPRRRSNAPSRSS